MPGVPGSTRSTRPTKRVWSPASCSPASAHSSQPSAPASSGPRGAVALVDPVPDRDRRHAAGEVLRQRELLGAEQRDGEAAGLAQQLVQRGLLRDRDADERRLERQGDERRDRQAEPLPSRSTVTTATPVG